MTATDPLREKSAAMMATPQKWPEWPFLPLARPTADGLDLGLMWDAFHAFGLTGYSATVFRVNLFDAYAFPTWSRSSRGARDVRLRRRTARRRLACRLTPAATFALTYWRLRPMSVWSNHEYFDHLPDRDPTAPLESPWDDDDTELDEPTMIDPSLLPEDLPF